MKILQYLFGVCVSVFGFCLAMFYLGIPLGSPKWFIASAIIGVFDCIGRSIAKFRSHLWIVFLLCVLCACAGNTLAMDRYAALAMLESGNNDHAIGTHGEISRYQILPSIWRLYTDAPISCATNPVVALAITRQIMTHRIQKYWKMQGIPRDLRDQEPTDSDFYILWNRPNCLIGAQIWEKLPDGLYLSADFSHCPRSVGDAADRFANLCSKP